MTCMYYFSFFLSIIDLLNEDVIEFNFSEFFLNTTNETSRFLVKLNNFFPWHLFKQATRWQLDHRIGQNQPRLNSLIKSSRTIWKSKVQGKQYTYSFYSWIKLSYNEMIDQTVCVMAGRRRITAAMIDIGAHGVFK